MNRFTCAVLLSLIIFCSLAYAQAPSTVVDPLQKGYTLQSVKRNYALTPAQLNPSVIFSADAKGLRLDLKDTTLYGRLHYGPEYFDYANSDYLEPRFRMRTDIKQGKALLDIAYFLRDQTRSNVNHWTTSGTFGYRLELLRVKDGVPVTLGMYDGRVDFKKTEEGFASPLSITEGPIVGCVQSDHPEKMVMGFATDRPSTGQIEIEEIGVYPDLQVRTQHEIVIGNLAPSHSYRYRAIAILGTDSVLTPWMTFRTAPPKGKGKVVFAYTGDARAESGGGENEYLGVNRTMISQITKEIYRKGAEFFLFGGDLIGGFSTSTDDFTLMLRGFKTTFEGFLHSTPVYSAMGNHETLYRAFTDTASKKTVMFDQWPYDSLSSEAVFAREFIQPSDGPEAYPGMPTYKRTVYAMQYGPVKTIVMNTNYWFNATNMIPEFGGSPEGYMLPNQVEWVEKEIKKADADPTVKYVVVLCHTPFFPNGGHLSSAMWHSGDNNVRAARVVDGKVTPFAQGVVEVRNRLAEAFSRSKKLAVVLSSDEHNYHRSLITSSTPIGVMADDLNKDGKLNDGKISPDAKLVYPTWYMVCGGAGAPYYTQQESPWSSAVKKFTAQNNYFIFTADEKKIGLEVYSASGQLLDTVQDLLAVKKK